MQQVDIPIDMFDSPQETVVIMPLGGVDKSSVQIVLEQDCLLISWERTMPTLKKHLAQTLGSCFRWSFQRRIPLHGKIAFDRIHSQLTPENILMIVVPKILLPDQIAVDIK